MTHILNGAAPQIFDLSRGGRPTGRLEIPCGDFNLQRENLAVNAAAVAEYRVSEFYGSSTDGLQWALYYSGIGEQSAYSGILGIYPTEAEAKAALYKLIIDVQGTATLVHVRANREGSNHVSTPE